MHILMCLIIPHCINKSYHFVLHKYIKHKSSSPTIIHLCSVLEKRFVFILIDCLWKAEIERERERERATEKERNSTSHKCLQQKRLHTFKARIPEHHSGLSNVHKGDKCFNLLLQDVHQEAESGAKWANLGTLKWDPDVSVLS